MKVMFFVLNKTELLDDLLSEFANRNVRGATVVESRGMARLLGNYHDDDEIPFLGSVRAYLNPERQKSNLIIACLKDGQITDVEAAIDTVIGDLSKPDTGVLFTVPVDYTKGLLQDGK